MQLVKTTVDKNNEKLTIFQSDTLSHTPVIPLMLTTYADLLTNGWVNSVVPFSNNNRVAWAQRDDGTVAGGICYEYRPDERCGWIILSFTAPTERCKGINSIVTEIVEADCKNLGAAYLSSYVNINNTPMLESLKATGRRLVAYKTSKRL